MNPKAVLATKKVIRKVPNKAVEAATALLIGKAFKVKPTPVRIVGALAAIAITHYIIEWAEQD